ncbi:MAG TPA: MlaD family protein [Actinomycetota bacterium]|nr:MlaD family protein [Actinomycetota bacterium]
MARGGLSILERNQRVIGAVALVLIAAGTVLALLLQGGLLTPSYTVTAMFTDAGGTRPGDNVTVAGLPAGRVAEIYLQEGNVAMELRVNRDVELPEEVRAEVVIETLLGRQSVALIPTGTEGTLEDGAVIPVERTTTPVDITDLNDISVRLLEGSDAEALEGFLRQVGRITEGKEVEVQALISGLEQVTAAVDSRRQQLGSLLESLRVLATTLGERDQTVASLIDNLDVVLGDLAERQEALEQLLVSTASASHETADLVRRNRGVLDSTLRNLHADLEVIDAHQLDLAATIAYLNQAVEGYSSVGYSGCKPVRTACTPNEWANIFVQSLGPLGVDALVGRCGLVDQLFDRYFGTDCETSGDGGGGGSAAAPAVAASAGGGPDAALLASAVVAEAPALPCSLDDLMDAAAFGQAAIRAAGGCTS